MTECPSCGTQSATTYRCDECGKDLVDADDNDGHHVVSDGGEDVAGLWRERLDESRVQIGRGLEPELLADRYDATSREEISELTIQATREMLRGDHQTLTLDDLDAAEEKLEDADPELLTDGGQTLEPTTHDVVLEAIDQLQSDGKHGAPVGAVVDQTIEETDVRVTAVLETVTWLQNHGRVYQPARGYLRRTDQVMDLDFDGGRR